MCLFWRAARAQVFTRTSNARKRFLLIAFLAQKLVKIDSDKVYSSSNISKIFKQTQFFHKKFGFLTRLRQIRFSPSIDFHFHLRGSCRRGSNPSCRGRTNPSCRGGSRYTSRSRSSSQRYRHHSNIISTHDHFLHYFYISCV